jgi:hypothetical protein
MRIPRTSKPYHLIIYREKTPIPIYTSGHPHNNAALKSGTPPSHFFDKYTVAAVPHA